METHENDPTTGEPKDPWNEFHERLGAFTGRLKETYRKVSSEEGPSENDIKEALGTLAGAWDQVSGSVMTAIQDPEVRRHLKDAALSLASAMGATISELGSELRDATSNGPDDPDQEEE